MYLSNERLLITGDVNIHLDDTTSINTHHFNEIINSHGLEQHVDKPTHIKGHMLDVVISSHKVINKKSLDVSHHYLDIFESCDHYPIFYDLNDISCDKEIHQDIIFRNLKEIDSGTFNDDLRNKLSGCCKIDDFHCALTSFNDCCLNVLDDHAPQIEKKIRIVPSAPWFDGEYKVLRQQRRKAEKKWIKTRLPSDRLAFTELRSQTSDLAKVKKKEYFTKKFDENKNNQKQLFHFVDTS